MKQIIILAILATSNLAAKVPVVQVTTPVPVQVGVGVPVEHHKEGEHVHHVVHDQHVHQKPSSVPPHVQHVVQHAHQHIQQVVNHHVSNQHKVPHVPTVVPVEKVSGVTPVAVHHHHVHVDVVQHHADGHKHVAHNHNVAGTPQHVVDKINKVEQHVHHVMQQAHQHIPQVINHQIVEKQKHKDQKPVVGDKVPVHQTQHVVAHVVHPVPEVTVKTTTM